jgi:DNA-binding CsgD family transcriptional regulator/tetratricopeptide (TPR) repeat protein
MLDWRYHESLEVSERALALARAVGDELAELRALTVRGVDLAYLGRGEEGLAELRLAVQRAEQRADPESVMRAYVNLTDVLMMLGRLHESAQLAREAIPVFRRYGLEDSTLRANLIESLVAAGEWDEADDLSAQAVRTVTATYPHHALITRGELEAGRGDFDAARAHLEAGQATLKLDRDLAAYDGFLAELALWERRWTDVESMVRHGLEHAHSTDMALIRVQLSAKGLRAQAELAALARARRDADAAREGLEHARRLLATARRAASEASAVTPNALGWLGLAEAEYGRADGRTQPEAWAEAAARWERLERVPLAAYCRWREAEALVGASASRAQAEVPLQAAHAAAARLKAVPLLRELELLAGRARLELAPSPVAGPGEPGLAETLDLTAREVEVLSLIARGYTNREIASELVISVKTAGVHVSHILQKLGAPNRREAAAIAHRVAPPSRSPDTTINA